MASIKIRDLFSGKFFEIPKYQRGYAWDVQNIRDLFNDIIESIESNSNHYIGTIVLSKSAKDEDKFYIVDGQQRITTLTLIISSLIRKLSEKDSFYYERFYLKEGDMYRITPLNRDQYFFINLLNGKVGDPQNKSQRLLKEAVEEINNKVDVIYDKLKFLKSIEKLEIMEFVENSEGDAIRIFQTVNDRGKPLSNMEKAKSLLIYFSNRYLNKKLDITINDCFSDIFELYDDINQYGNDFGINLIKNKDFSEDNLMRYHFVTYSNENYDPSSNYVLQYLKRKLVEFRNEEVNNNYLKIEKFIHSYIGSLLDFFKNCKQVIERVKIEPKYYKIFVILNLSATLYPLIIKLEKLGLLNQNLSGQGREQFSFFDLVELIEVRVYKTRGTDPKADISRLLYDIDSKKPIDIENWLVWFNNRWMPKEEFKSNLLRGVYGNRALNYIFITYCESINNKEFDITEIISLSSKTPNIEHILSQTPTFEPTALGFNNKEDFIDFEHTIGNLTILEKGINSSVQNKSALEKIDGYGRSLFSMTKKLASQIDTRRRFDKNELKNRTKILADYCSQRWWCDISIDSLETKVTIDEETQFIPEL